MGDTACDEVPTEQGTCLLDLTDDLLRPVVALLGRSARRSLRASCRRLRALINAKSKWTLQRVSLASLGPRLPNLQAATLLVHTVNGAVERQCLAALAGLPSLQCLVIDGTGAVGTNDSATSGFEAPTCLPSLAALGFDQPAEGLLLLAARLSHLTALGVSACGHVANLRLGHLSALTALQALKLQDCNGLTPARMAFLSCLTALRELELGKNSYEEPLELATLQGMTALQRAWAAERKAAAAA